MPNRTDDPPRTRPSIEVVPDSARAAPGAPAAQSARAATCPDLLESHDDLITEESFRAILSSHQRAGRWESADEIEVLAVCGEVTLDFTRADLPESGVVDIDARAIMGEVKIVVPDGAEIELEGAPFIGSIEQHVRKKGARERIREWVTGEREEDFAPPLATVEPPLFRIDARAILGVVKVMGR